MAQELTARSRRGANAGAGSVGPVGRALAAAALALPLASGMPAFGPPAFAAQGADAPGPVASAQMMPQTKPQASIPNTVPQASTPKTRLGQAEAASVEKHIATLHRQLQITPAQEPLWRSLAGAMRDSVLQLDIVYAERKRDYGTMSAVDDLKSYGMVQQVHARNVQSLIEPFQRLYDSFDASQKRAADETLRNFTGNAIRNPR